VGSQNSKVMNEDFCLKACVHLINFNYIISTAFNVRDAVQGLVLELSTLSTDSLSIKTCQ